MDGGFDGFNGVEFHVDFEAARFDAVSQEHLVDDFANGGLGVEGNELEAVEVFLLDDGLLGEGMVGRNDQCEFILGVGHHIERVL